MRFQAADVSFVLLTIQFHLSASAPVETGSTTTRSSVIKEIGNVAVALLNSSALQLSEILADASQPKTSTALPSTKPVVFHSSTQTRADADGWVQNTNGRWEWKGISTTRRRATSTSKSSQAFMPQIMLQNVTNSTGQIIGERPQLVLEPLNKTTIKELHPAVSFSLNPIKPSSLPVNQSFVSQFRMTNVTNSAGDVVGVRAGIVLELLNSTSSSTTSTSTTTSSPTTTTKATSATVKSPSSSQSNSTPMSTVPINTFLSNSSVSASVFDSVTDLAGAHLKVGERLIVSAVLPESNTVILRVKNENNSSSTTKPEITLTSTSRSSTKALDEESVGSANNENLQSSERSDKVESLISTSKNVPKDGLSFVLSSDLFRQAVTDAVKKEMEKFKALEAKRLEDERNEIAKTTPLKNSASNDNFGVFTLVEKSRSAPAQTTSTKTSTATTTISSTTTSKVRAATSTFSFTATRSQEEQRKKSDQNNAGDGQPAVTFSTDSLSYGLDSLFQGVMGLINGGSSMSSSGESSPASFFSSLLPPFDAADTLRAAQKAAVNFQPPKQLRTSFS